MLRYGLFALGAFTVLSGTAQADVFGYQVLGKKVQISHQETADQVSSVYDYDRPEFRPEGKPVGGFKLYSAIGADILFEDNLYAADANEESDIVKVYTPAVVLKSQWGRHELVGRVHAKIGRYQEAGSENYDDYGASLSGRLDVKRNSYATGYFGFSENHEERGDPDQPGNSDAPTTYSDTSLQAGYVHAPGKLSLSGLVDYKIRAYDNALTNAGALLDQRFRNRDESVYTIQVGYEIKPAYEAFLRGSYKEVDYSQATTNGSTPNRDADQTNLVAGMALDMGGKVLGEVFLGYVDRNYNSKATYASVGEATYGANILWNANGLTSLELKAYRTVDETTNGSDSAYLNNSLSLELEHELRRNILLGASAGYAEHDYQGYTATRDDEYTTFKAEGRYLLNKNFNVGLGYDYTRRDSNQANNDYDENRVMLRFSAAL